MIEIVSPARPSHAVDVMQRPNPGQLSEDLCTPDMVQTLNSQGTTWAVLIDGTCVAIGAVYPVWKGRAIVLGFLGAHAGPAMTTMTRRIRKELKALEVDYPRLEAYVARHYKDGHRWIRLLGFTREGLMKKFAHGQDYVLYSRVK